MYGTGGVIYIYIYIYRMAMLGVLLRAARIARATSDGTDGRRSIILHKAHGPLRDTCGERRLEWGACIINQQEET
jgi:hypothetical protein